VVRGGWVFLMSEVPLYWGYMKVLVVVLQ